MTTLYDTILDLLKQSPMSRSDIHDHDSVDDAGSVAITSALIRLRDAGKIVYNSSDRVWEKCGPFHCMPWFLDIFHDGPKTVMEIDTLARRSGITPDASFWEYLCRHPEFVYLSFGTDVNGHQDYRWTLAAKPEAEKPDPGRLDYATGASRSSEGEDTRFELISPIALDWICLAAAEDHPTNAAIRTIGEPRLLIAGAASEIYAFLSGGNTEDPDRTWVRRLAFAALYALKAAHVERDGDPLFHELSPKQTQQIEDLGLPRFDLLPPRGLMAVAETYKEGAVRRTAHNWEAGMPVHDMLNRSLRHFTMWLDQDRSDPHLGHGLWGIFGSIHSLVMWPELNRGKLRKRGCIAPFLPDADDKVDDESVVGQVTPMLQSRIDEMVQNGTAIS